jgi:hypothetical protein
MVSNLNSNITWIKYSDDKGSITAPEPDHELMIMLLTHEQIASDDRSNSWAQEVEEGFRLKLQVSTTCQLATPHH